MVGENTMKLKQMIKAVMGLVAVMNLLELSQAESGVLYLERQKDVKVYGPISSKNSYFDVEGVRYKIIPFEFIRVKDFGFEQKAFSEVLEKLSEVSREHTPNKSSLSCCFLNRALTNSSKPSLKISGSFQDVFLVDIIRMVGEFAGCSYSLKEQNGVVKVVFFDPKEWADSNRESLIDTITHHIAEADLDFLTAFLEQEWQADLNIIIEKYRDKWKEKKMPIATFYRSNRGVLRYPGISVTIESMGGFWRIQKIEFRREND